MNNSERSKYSSISLTYEDFKERFLSIKDCRDAALIASIYCAYARVGEIVKGRYKKNPPITKNSIEITPNHIKITVLTEKIQRWRTVPTNREIDGWLHAPIFDWMEEIKEPELFPFTTRWAQKIFEKHFETQHIHLLRHWACTHALQQKRSRKTLHPNIIARLGGWTSLDTFYKTYAHMVTEDYIDLI